jgi:hypothetical protein
MLTHCRPAGAAAIDDRFQAGHSIALRCHPAPRRSPAAPAAAAHLRTAGPALLPRRAVAFQSMARVSSPGIHSLSVSNTLPSPNRRTFRKPASVSAWLGRQRPGWRPDQPGNTVTSHGNSMRTWRHVSLATAPGSGPRLRHPGLCPGGRHHSSVSRSASGRYFQVPGRRGHAAQRSRNSSRTTMVSECHSD